VTYPSMVAIGDGQLVSEPAVAAVLPQPGAEGHVQPIPVVQLRGTARTVAWVN
jgi:hypothetical protein